MASQDRKAQDREKLCADQLYYASLALAAPPNPMAKSKNPLAKLDRQELLWLAGILKDACRERLEKNIVSQAFEERLYQRGPMEGRLDPRPFLKIWEPRYRKFLEIASELQATLEGEDAKAVAESLRAQVEPDNGVSRHGPVSAQAIIEMNATNTRRKSRSR
jgi:hypothetical protein